MDAIRRALDVLSGRAEPRMSGDPRYVVVRDIGPGPQRTDSA
jgi:C-6 monooxygenase